MRLALIALAPLAFAAPALAQEADPLAHHRAPPAAQAPADPHAGHAAPAAQADPHAGHGVPSSASPDPHAGHTMPSAPADPHAEHRSPAAPADPHAGHGVSAPADPHAEHRMPGAQADPHAGHTMPAPAGQATPPPPPPADHAADRFYPPEQMAAARAQLREEHGDINWSTLVLETAEFRPSSDGDGYALEAEAAFGGDVNRFVLAVEGEGLTREGVHHLEAQALYSRAITPYFNLRAGLRQDFEPRPRRTYATVGIEGLAPYWIELSAALFVSDRGDLSSRIEASTDFRLTQRLVLQPRLEVDLAASDDLELGLGSGFTEAEMGLRLRYHLTPAFAPYVGVVHQRAFGQTADLVRASGEEASHTRAVIGLHAMF